MTFPSCRTLRCLPLEALDLAFNSGVLLRQRSLNQTRTSVPVGYHANVGTAEIELAGHATLDIAGELRSVSGGVHIFCEGNDVARNRVSLEESQYYRDDMEVKKKSGAVIRIFSGESLAQRIKRLRKGLQLKQAELAALCGVGQASVSQWERNDDPSTPTSKALLKLSELAPVTERQWWRDQAAEQAGFDLEHNDSSGTYAVPLTFRTIPLLKSSRGMGTLGTVALADIERNLHFPAEWFPEGGTIRAVRIQHETTSEMIAMVDISRRDPDRLVGHLVAVQMATGVEVRWLAVEDDTYMLLPFQPGQTLKLLRPHGENSIVGLVRWIGDSVDLPEHKKRTQ